MKPHYKLFGHYKSNPQPSSWYGQSGWFTVPAGYHWYQVVDSSGQIWVSPNPITKNSDGSVSGDPLYAAEIDADLTLKYIDLLAARKTNADSPAFTRFTQTN